MSKGKLLARKFVKYSTDGWLEFFIVMTDNEQFKNEYENYAEELTNLGIDNIPKTLKEAVRQLYEDCYRTTSARSM